MPAETSVSPKRRKLEERVDQSLSVLDRKSKLPDEPTATIENQRVRNALQRNRQYGDLPLDVIRPDPDQVRRVDTASESFAELVASVREHGVLEPITVRWIETKKSFQIVTGERRYQAAKRVGLETIPAVVRDVTDTDKAVHQLVENLQRENMNPIEEAKAFHHYLAATGQSQQQLARRIGKSETYVSRIMSILEKLTREEQEQLAVLATSQLPGKSLIIEALRIPDAKTRFSILRGELTVRQARDEVTRKKGVAPRHKVFRMQFGVPDHNAQVTVSLRKSDATHEEVLAILKAVTKDFEKRLEKGRP